MRSRQRSLGLRRRWAAVVVTALAAALVAIPGPAAANPIGPADPNSPYLACLHDADVAHRCYGPAQMQSAYGLSPLLALGATGQGTTIVIVGAYNDDHFLNEDLGDFDATFRLPGLHLTQIAPFGLGSPPNYDRSAYWSWMPQIPNDVEWAHAMAPGARIVLALAPSNSDIDLARTVAYVVDHDLGDVVSQSISENERCVDPTALKMFHTAYANAARKQITVLAGTGDNGASQDSCDGTGLMVAVGYPASDPNVTSVGATAIAATVDGGYLGEEAWGRPTGDSCFDALPGPGSDNQCGGGGYSTIFARPAYQASSLGSGRPAGRGVPDIAAPSGQRLLVHNGLVMAEGLVTAYADTFFPVIRSTVSTPIWAGLIAVADQIAGRRLGPINPSLYAINQLPWLYGAVLHDITVGNNVVPALGAGYRAAPGWDPVTGLGTPKATYLLPLLALIAIWRGPTTLRPAASRMPRWPPSSPARVAAFPRTRFATVSERLR